MLWLIVVGVVVIALAGLSRETWFWVWYRKAFDARGDEKRPTIRGRLYYCWANGRMTKWSYATGVVGAVLTTLGGLLP